MKIKNINCVTAVGLSRTIEDKHATFELHEFGIIAKPKGKASFNNRPRLIPWANVASCDIVTEEEEEVARLALEEATKAFSVPPALEATISEKVAAKVEEERSEADTIVFSKDANGKVSEKRRSAFSEAAKAKAE